LRPVVTAGFLAGVTLLLYGYQLAGQPANGQESLILEQARSGSGPLFFHAGGNQWLQPWPVHLTAAIEAGGGGNTSARLATLLVAALNVALLFLCARRIFDSTLAAVAASFLLLATPAHITFARSGTDAILSVPFVLLWLLAMLRFWTFDSTASILAAGAALGAGVYSNRAAPLTMGFLIIVSLVALIAGGRRWRSVALIVAAFGVLLMPAAIWFALNPATYADTFGRWAVHLAHVINPVDGLRAFLNWNTLGNRASLYWGFFDPSWLFFDNMFVIVMLPMLLAGIGLWGRALPRHVVIVVGGGALAAPLAGSSFGEPCYAADALTLLPFAILLMTSGLMLLVMKIRGRQRTYRSADTAPAG
jgi:4-amino-4-deoxy-L-arabinose transferase-like glycosyltransferase